MIYILFLFFIFLNTAIIRQNNMFLGFYDFLKKNIKSNKLLVFLISLISGVLPISGRVSVSASMLDTLHLKNKQKLGVIDYLSTHHYYLWSPLEKTIIIPMAALSMSYLDVMSYLWPLLAVTLIYTIAYIKVLIREEDVEIRYKNNFDNKGLFFVLTPLLAGIGFLIAGYSGPIIFSILAFYYMVFSKSFKFWKYINWKLVGLLFFIILSSNYISSYTNEFQEYIKNKSDLLVGCILGFLFAFLLGSSGKFIGIAVILTQIFGLEYFTLFFAIEYAGYLISPSHKCTCIGKMYFNTPVIDYAKALLLWVILIILTGISVI